MPTTKRRSRGAKFDWLTREALDSAVASIILEGRIPPRRRSTYYDLVVNDKTLPPKYVIERAAAILKRRPSFTASDFAGGDGPPASPTDIVTAIRTHWTVVGTPTLIFLRVDCGAAFCTRQMRGARSGMLQALKVSVRLN